MVLPIRLRSVMRDRAISSLQFVTESLIVVPPGNGLNRATRPDARRDMDSGLSSPASGVLQIRHS